MPKYGVVFIDKSYKPIKQLTINAFSAVEAMIKAEETYKVKEWNFDYIDLYAEFLG